MQQVCECKAVYSVGAPACPQCSSTKFVYDHETPAVEVAVPVEAKPAK